MFYKHVIVSLHIAHSDADVGDGGWVWCFWCCRVWYLQGLDIFADVGVEVFSAFSPLSALSGTEFPEALNVDGVCDVRVGVFVFVGHASLMGMGILEVVGACVCTGLGCFFYLMGHVAVHAGISFSRPRFFQACSGHV